MPIAGSCEICGATLPPRHRKICGSESCRRRYKTQKQRIYGQPGYKPRASLSPEQLERRRQLDRERGKLRAGKRNSWEWNLKHAHGMTPDQWYALWADRAGNCYLCGLPLPEDRARVAIDHDHDHCPDGRSCSYCRRGLTHHGCNRAIGMVGEDTAALRRIADNLDRAKSLMAARLRDAPAQLDLLSM